MRVLWVYEALTTQMIALAAEIQRQPDIRLEIMTSHPLPAELAHLATPRVTCQNKLDFNARKSIRDQLKLGNYDIAHAYTSRNLANLLGACQGLEKSPRIVGYRGTIDQLHVLDPANWITFWHPRVASIICVCEATKAALTASGIPSQKLAAVWEGCHPESFQALPRSKLLEYDIPPDAFVVGTVANVRRVKGVDLMLRSAIELAGKLDIYWLVVGAIRDPLVQKLAQDPRLNGRVKLVGSKEKGGEYSGLFDIYVAPSRKEGLSMAIMEAMTHTCCPVVTRVGGNSELIRHEVDGLVIPPEDSQALSRAVCELFADSAKRQRLATSAYRRVVEVFSILAWCNRLCDTYRRITASQHWKMAA